MEVKYSGNGTIINDENIILASSNKNRLSTIDHNNVYDPSTLESGRLKSSYSKAETNCRSVASLMVPEDSKSTILFRRRNVQNTPIGKNRSSVNFKKVVNNYSSKGERRNNGNLIPWSSNVRSLPKQHSRYSRGNSKKQLAMAYKSIPKESILSRRNVGSRRTNHSRKSKIPPTFKDNKQDDEALCMILKQFNSQSEANLPNVRPGTDQKYKSKIKPISNHNHKHVSNPYLMTFYNIFGYRWSVIIS